LNQATLCLLTNVECAAVFGNVLADLEAKSLAGAEWPASREKRIEHAILPSSLPEDCFDTFPVRAWLIANARIATAALTGSRTVRSHPRNLIIFLSMRRTLARLR